MAQHNDMRGQKTPMTETEREAAMLALLEEQRLRNERTMGNRAKKVGKSTIGFLDRLTTGQDGSILWGIRRLISLAIQYSRAAVAALNDVIATRTPRDDDEDNNR